MALTKAEMAERLFLEERGLVVVGEAASAQEIDPLLQGLRPDLLLLDWELPGLREEGSDEVPAWTRTLRVVALSSRPVGKPDPLASPIEFVCKTDSPDCLIAALFPLSRGEPLADASPTTRPDSGSTGPGPISGPATPLSRGS